MKSKQKQTPTEIIDNQRQAVVEKIIEDMKRDGLRWAEPYLPSLTPHNPVSGTDQGFPWHHRSGSHPFAWT